MPSGLRSIDDAISHRTPVNCSHARQSLGNGILGGKNGGPVLTCGGVCRGWPRTLPSMMTRFHFSRTLLACLLRVAWLRRSIGTCRALRE